MTTQPTTASQPIDDVSDLKGQIERLRARQRREWDHKREFWMIVSWGKLFGFLGLFVGLLLGMVIQTVSLTGTADSLVQGHEGIRTLIWRRVTLEKIATDRASVKPND